MRKTAMKSLLALCLMVVSTIGVSAQQVSFSVKNVTVKVAVRKFKQATGYSFVFGSNKVDTQKLVSVEARNEPIGKVVAQILNGQNLDYEIKGKFIVVKEKLQSVPQSGVLPAGVVKVKGKVVDANGDPIIGATVMQKGSAHGVITDVDGQYSMEVPVGSELEISYVGYNTRHVQAAPSMNIVMAEATTAMDEVVVIGYGTVRKKDLTGAVSAINGEELASRKTTNVSAALQGSIPGLMVRRTGNAPGASASSMLIRGVTTISDSNPLIIVDGVQTDNIDYVNANDIESVSVLKDAAAASIYGSMAAAGVILITTKRGNAADMSLSYMGEFGLEIPTAQPKMTGVTRYLEMYNELLYNDNPTGGFFQQYSSDQVKNWVDYNQTDPNNYPITDWTGLMLKSSAPRTTHSITVNGGNKAVRSKASATLDKIDALYDGRSFKRIMFRSNTDINISEKLSATVDVSVRNAKSVNTVYTPFDGMRKMPAIYPATWADGRIASGKSGANPYGMLLNGGDSKAHSTQLGAKASLAYKPFAGFSLQAVFSPHMNFGKTKTFRKAASYTQMDSPDAFGGWLSGFSTTKLNETRNDGWHITSQLLADYSKQFHRHHVSLMAGYENYIIKTESLTASRDQYELTQYPYLSVGPTDYMDNGGSGTEYTSNSFFGRLLYSYADRYLLQANIRRDGSSRFHHDYRWGNFPSFSAGWVITEEPFWKSLHADWLSFLKLRASWGKLGNERIGSYFPYMSLMAFRNSYFYQDGSVVSGKAARANTLAVKDITWETTTTTDIGLDMTLLQGRLRVTADYYSKKTTDMLLAVEIPYTMGFDNPDTNAGKMSTRGWDLELAWNHHLGALEYGVSVNLSDFLSRVDYMNDADFINGGRILRGGEYYYARYGYVCEGIYQTQEEVDNSARTSGTVTVGDLKYKDISGPDGVPDGIISSEYDRVVLGNSLPRYQFGGNIHLGWKGIDFSATFQGVGRQNSYIDRAMVEPLRDNYGNMPAIIDGKYWSVFNTEQENLHAAYPRLTNVTKSNNYAVSDFWIFNGRYLRMKNMTLGYTLPQVWTQSVGINKCRAYISASDLFCISKFPQGWDPEMGTTSYPITTSLVFGISFNF